MRRKLTLISSLLLLILSACAAETPVTPVATATPLVLLSTESPATPTEVAATVAPSAVPATATPIEPTVTPEPTATVIADDLSVSAENVYLYPVDQLYTGDRVTFQVRARVPDVVDPYAVAVQIFVDGEQVVDDILGGNRNLNGDTIGLYQWAWEIGSTGGSHTIQVVLDPEDSITAGDENPDNNIASFDVEVLLSERQPPLMANQVWEAFETAYANIYVVSGTTASRDIDELMVMVDQAIVEAADVLQVPPVVDRKLNFYFIDRVIGQGGYAGSSIVISYLDRNYAGGGLYEVLVHESIHVLDGSFEPDDRFTFLTEGFAVWGTGGHYKREQLDQRAAGLLLDTQRYVPLAELINNFYPAQHEVGYLEAGAFVKYLVDLHGYESVRRFFSGLEYVADRSEAESISLAMRSHFGKTLAQLESDWHVYLQSQARTADTSLDLELTIEFYDLMRSYQQVYDPTAYFLYAWLPFPDALRDEGLTADVTRHPRAEINVVLETMLESADTALRNGDFSTTRTLMDSIQRVLDNDGRFLDPIAGNYLQLVRKSAELGHEAQDITVTFANGTAPLATIISLDLETGARLTYNMTLEGSEWVVLQ